VRTPHPLVELDRNAEEPPPTVLDHERSLTGPTRTPAQADSKRSLLTLASRRSERLGPPATLTRSSYHPR
jgi:hypothetical protein